MTTSVTRASSFWRLAASEHGFVLSHISPQGRVGDVDNLSRHNGIPLERPPPRVPQRLWRNGLHFNRFGGDTSNDIERVDVFRGDAE